MKRSMLVVAAVLILLGLAAVFVFVIKPESKVYAEEDAAGIIEIGVGDTFIVELKANPSTGYSWHYTFGQEGIITLESDQYKAVESTDLVGAPGKHEFVFKALEAGNTQVQFEYYQPWESENIAETYVFNFAVK